MLPGDTDRRLAEFVDKANGLECDFIVQLGDFCRPQSSSDSIMAIWNSFNGPGYHVIGNHDTDGGYSRDDVRAYWGMPANYYSFDVKGWHFVVLDGNDVKNPPQSGYDHWIGQAQQTWLANDLASTTNPTIIFTHQPISGGAWAVENHADIRAIVEQANANSRKVIACFQGHTHYDEHEIINGIHYVKSNSTTYQWVKNVGPYYYADPVYSFVSIFDDGTISIKGRETTWTGDSPSDDGHVSYPIGYEGGPAAFYHQMR